MSPVGEDLRSPVLSQWVGRLSGVGPVRRAPQEFMLAGIDWQAPHRVRIELRAHLTSGRWTPWVSASVLGHDSDRGETVAHALVGEPVWTGPANAVQLRSRVPVDGLNLHLVRADAVLAKGTGEPSAATPTAASAAAAAAGGLPLATPVLPAGSGQPPIIARRAWAGGLLPRVAPYYGDIRLAFVHHSVNANGYSSAQVPAMLRSIYYFHTFTRGWNDFGYNFAIDAYGRIWEGRAGGIDRPVMGAQAGGYNLESFGAVLLGDYAATLPTPAAQQALARLVAWKLALHGVPIGGRVTVEVDPSDAFYTRYRPGQHVSLPRIAGHRDGCTTDCPGEDMYVNGMPVLRRAVRQRIGRQVTLSLESGPPPGSAYHLAPYPIAPGIKVKPASYLELGSVTLTVGRELALHGFLRSLSGEPLPHAPISLQDLSATRQGEHQTDLAVLATREDGMWVTTLTPHSNQLLRALHARAPAAASALIVIAVAPLITLGLTRRGDGVVATGTVTPAKRHVVLEVAEPGGKHEIVQRKIVDGEGGVFSGRLHLMPGRYWVRATTQADPGNVAGASSQAAVYI